MKKMSSELVTMDMTVRVSDGHDDVRLCDDVSMSMVKERVRFVGRS